MPSDRPELDPAVDPALLPPMLAPSRTALVIIDVQEDFLSPEGPAGEWGVDFGLLEPPLARIEALIPAARAAGVVPVFVRVVTRPETDSTALTLLHRRKGRPDGSVALCRAGTKGADYYRIRPAAGDIEIEKALYSSFVGTDLDAQLRARGIDTLVVTGFTTDCCVDCTVRDAFHLDYHVFVASDACAAYDAELHDATLKGLAQNCAILVTADEVIGAWG